ncbi:ribosome assembly protein METTL17, mitochondrial isoform X2 [Ptiloglossa arizonensis]
MKVLVTMDEALLHVKFKHKNHPGIIKPKQVEQSNWLLDTVKKILKNESISAKSIYESGQKLALHLHGRHVPFEEKDIPSKLERVKLQIQSNTEEMTDKDLLKDPNALKLLKQLIHNWKPIHYDKYTSLSYLVSRSAPEYTVMYKILNEIRTKDTNFIPKSLYDYGSGIGTVLWAASQFWFKSITEYICVDSSSDMIDLSAYLVKNATPQIQTKHIFYRQFLSSMSIPTYDIVVSAYSLFELPNQKSRIKTITNLWQKTKNYLIIVENGTNAGFTIINEARDFLLNSFKDTSSVHLFSPCPHDLNCPRINSDNKPCNFEVFYLTLGISRHAQYKKERYSYVVFKKDKRPENDNQWPRIVRPVLKRSKHVICHMCTASGKLEEHIFTKWKNGRHIYRCARSSEWNDCLPFKIENVESIKEPE